MLPRSRLPSFLRAFGAALLLFLAGCGPAPAPEGDGEGLVLLPYEGPLARGVESRDPRPNFHDFGRVPDGERVIRVFQLRNTDPRDVSITRVDPGCGCTVAALRVVRADGTVEKGEPIRSNSEKLLTVGPGELAEIEVVVNTRDISSKNVDKLVTMRVLTDSPNGYFLTLEVHILVEKPFAVVPGRLDLGRIPASGGGRGKVEIVQSGHFYYELKELLPTPEGVFAELSHEIRNGSPVWTLHAELAAPLPRGPYDETLLIATEEAPGQPGRELEVQLTALVVGDFAADPQRIVFAGSRDTALRSSSEFRSLLGGHRLRLTGVTVPEEHRPFLTAVLEPVDPDDDGSSLRWLITMETVPPLPADETMLSGRLVLALDDPQHPEQELEYVVHLR